MRNSFSIKTICIVSIILLSVGCSLANSGKQNKPSPKGKKEVIQINPDKLIPYPDFPIQKFLAMQEKLDKGNVGEAEAKLLVDSIDKAVLYDIIYSEGCSWYCGGSYKSLTSSSCQKNTGKIGYQATNAHDFDLTTAWVEGAEGQGIGESLTYTFAGNCPRITAFEVVNGYVKSEQAWQENSRVRQLKVYYNNRPYKVLNLKDMRGMQIFKVDTLGYHQEGAKDWSLKFEILDVYPGTKYEDTAITEIHFDGIDVH